MLYFFPKTTKSTLSKVELDHKFRYCLSLCFIGLQRTEELLDAALITSHGESLPSTHDLLPAACCIDTAQQPLRAQIPERRSWSMARMSGVGVCQRGVRRPNATTVRSRPLGVVEIVPFHIGYSYSCSYHNYAGRP